MRTKLLLAGALIGLLAVPAGAQQAPRGTPTRIRGTVEKLDGQALTVKPREGEQVTVTLAPNVTIGYLVKKSLADRSRDAADCAGDHRTADRENRSEQVPRPLPG